MDHGAVVSRIVEEIKNDGTLDFDLDDPFDDPSLVTTAFMDILWQDEHGNSALMLAAAENRVLHVKGILTMAIQSGKLWQVLDMCNNEGLSCVQMAVRAGSETCAMLITKVAREYAKHKPRPKKVEEMANEEDVTFNLKQKNSEKLEDENYFKELIRQPSSSSMISVPPKPLNREKLSNNLRGNKGHEYLQMVRRSRSAHSHLISQRTFSLETSSIDSETSNPQLTLPNQDQSVLSSVGEKLKTLFGRKPPSPSASLDRVASSRRALPAVDKTSFYLESRTEPTESSKARPVSEDEGGTSTMFRSSPWQHSKVVQRTNPPNPVRLPPLNMRRRANSDSRNREFSSLGDEDN